MARTSLLSVACCLLLACQSAPDGTTAREVLCGAGTSLQGQECVGTSSGATCGPGTVLQGAQCIPAGQPVACGSGTTLKDGECVATGGPGCGPRTTVVDGVCVGTGATCGKGTLLEGSECLPDAQKVKRGFRDSCSVNADCGCYANGADDPTCTATNKKQLICKSSLCTIDCQASSECTAIFPAGVYCTSSRGYCL